MKFKIDMGKKYKIQIEFKPTKSAKEVQQKIVDFIFSLPEKSEEIAIQKKYLKGKVVSVSGKSNKRMPAK